MYILAIITFILLVISFLINRKKTIIGLKLAIKKIIYILIPVFSVIIIVSIALYFVTEDTISAFLLNDNKYLGVLTASALGSITMMPGYIAFPLCRILRQNGVYFMIISAFATTLMMVGILTLPVEKKYFGIKVAIIRNAISFIIAILVSLITGLFFGEIF